VYATSEPNKILTEDDFVALKNTIFSQYSGKAKALDKRMRQRAKSASETLWGTAQVNLCISEEETGSDQDTSTQPNGNDSPSSQGYEDTAVLTTPPETPAKKTYVLSVGAPTEDLKYSDQDAKLFTKAVKKRLAIDESNIRRVLGKQATYEGVVGGLKWLEQNTQPEDGVIIYFSGHGSSTPDIAPLDEADGRDEAFVLYHTGGIGPYREALAQKKLLLDDEFNVLLKKIPARYKIVVADCCHSGSIYATGNTGRLKPKFLPTADYGMEDMKSPKSKALPVEYGKGNELTMAACKDSQYAYEDPEMKNSLFTYYLAKQINSGVSSFGEAFQKAKAATEKHVKKWGGSQSGNDVPPQEPTITDPKSIAHLFRFAR
jgi:hypothetical protein